MFLVILFSEEPNNKSRKHQKCEDVQKSCVCFALGFFIYLNNWFIPVVRCILKIIYTQVCNYYISKNNELFWTTALNNKRRGSFLQQTQPIMLFIGLYSLDTLKRKEREDLFIWKDAVLSTNDSKCFFRRPFSLSIKKGNINNLALARRVYNYLSTITSTHQFGLGSILSLG